MSTEILVFAVSGRTFALRVTQVREVLRAASLTEAPPTDPPREGVLNLRGQSVGVLDLRRMLGLPAMEIHPDQYLIVLECPPQHCAIRVDGTVDLHQIDEAAIRPSDEVSGAGIEIREVAHIDLRVVFLLDIADLTKRPASTA